MSYDPRFEIVVGVDLAEWSETVLVHAFDEALRHEQPVLHVLFVIRERHHWFHRPDEDRGERPGDRRALRDLEELTARVAADVVPRERRRETQIQLHVRRGLPEEQIAMLADETNADLIVVGRFNHERDAVADHVLQLASCPVLVVNPAPDRSASARQCPACVRVRAETDGEQWFCDRHHQPHVHHILYLGESMPTLRGGPML